jgi:hypothetical protein
MSVLERCRLHSINSDMWATERTARSTCDHTIASYASGCFSQADSEGLSKGDILRADTPRSEASAISVKPSRWAHSWIEVRCLPGDVVTSVR